MSNRQYLSYYAFKVDSREISTFWSVPGETGSDIANLIKEILNKNNILLEYFCDQE